MRLRATETEPKPEEQPAQARRWAPMLALISWLPLAGALAFLVALAPRLRQLISNVYWVSDMASIPVISEDISWHRPGQTVWVGTAAHYNDFVFNLATRWLPFHRWLWEVWPAILSVATIGLVAWGTWRVAGRWAGLTALAIAVSMGPYAVYASLGQGLRSPTWFTIALLAATIAYVVSRDRPLGRGRMAAVVLGVGGVAGFNTASDMLLAANGLLPLVLVGAVSLPFGHAGKDEWSRRIATVALGTAGVSVLVILGLKPLMQWVGFRLSVHYDLFALTGIATPLDMVKNLGAVSQAALPVVAGYLPAVSTTAKSIATAALALVLALQAWMVARPVLCLRRALGPEGAGRPGRYATLYGLFWGTASMATLGVLCVADVAEGFVANAARMLLVVFYAAAATVPIWASRMELTRALIVAPVLALAFFNIQGQRPLMDSLNNDPLARSGPELLGIFEKEGVTRGYSAYPHALGLSWQSGMRVRVSPVDDCGPRVDGLCPFELNAADTFFKPSMTGRSFLLIGPPDSFALPPEPPAEFGPWAAEHTVGPFRVLVYDYDVGSRLNRAASSALSTPAGAGRWR